MPIANSPAKLVSLPRDVYISMASFGLAMAHPPQGSGKLEAATFTASTAIDTASPTTARLSIMNRLNYISLFPRTYLILVDGLFMEISRSVPWSLLFKVTCKPPASIAQLISSCLNNRPSAPPMVFQEWGSLAFLLYPTLRESPRRPPLRMTAFVGRAFCFILKESAPAHRA